MPNKKKGVFKKGAETSSPTQTRSTSTAPLALGSNTPPPGPPYAPSTPPYGNRTPPYGPTAPSGTGDPPALNISPPAGIPVIPAIVPTTTTTTIPPPRSRSPTQDPRMTEFLSQQAEITRRTEEHINLLSDRIVELNSKLNTTSTGASTAGHAGIINNIYCSGTQPAATVVSGPIDDGSTELLKQIEQLEQEKTKLARESAERHESEIKLKLDLAEASEKFNTLARENNASKIQMQFLTGELAKITGEKQRCEQAKSTLDIEKKRIEQKLTDIEKGKFELEQRQIASITDLQRMMADLNSKLKKCDSDKTGLLAQIQSLRDDATNDLSRMKELQKELDDSKASSGDASTQMAQLKQEKQEAEAKRTACENEVNSLKAQIQNLTTEIETLKRQLSESQASQAAASQLHSQLEQKNNEASGSVSSLQAKITALEGELAALKTQQTTSGDETSAKIAELEAEITRLKAELERAKASQAETETAKNNAEAKKKECDEKVAALQNQLAAATSKNDSDIPKLQSDLAQKDTEISNLKNQLAEIQSQQTKATADKEALDLQVKKCEDDKGLLQAEIDKNKLRIQELESDKASKDSELEGIKTQLDKTNNDLTKANDDIKINKESFDREREVLKKLALTNAKGFDELNSRIEELEEEKRKLNRQLDEVTKQLKSCTEKNKDNESKIKQLELLPKVVEPVPTTTTTEPPVPTTTTTEPPVQKIKAAYCDRFKVGDRVNIRGDPSIVFIVKEIIRQPETLDREGDCYEAVIVKELEPDSKPFNFDISKLEAAVELRGDDCRRFHPGQFLKCETTTLLNKNGEVLATSGIYKVISARSSMKRGEECNVTMIRYDGSGTDLRPSGSQVVIKGKDLNYFKVIPDPTLVRQAIVSTPVDPLANLVAATKIQSPYRRGGTKKRHRTPKKKAKSRTYRRR